MGISQNIYSPARKWLSNKFDNVIFLPQEWLF